MSRLLPELYESRFDELAGLRTVDLVTRFLPYSTKGRLPTDPRLVRAYLAIRPAWWFLGRQTLYVGEPAG